MAFEFKYTPTNHYNSAAFSAALMQNQRAREQMAAQQEQLQYGRGVEQAIGARLSEIIDPASGELDMARAPAALAPFGERGYHTLAALAQWQRAMKESKTSTGRAPTAYELAIRKSGGTTGHPLVDTLTPEAAGGALAEGSPGNVFMGSDAQGNPYPMFLPRGAGGAAPRPLAAPKPERVSEKDLDTISKLEGDIRSIDALLGATKKKPSPEEVATAKEAGVKRDPNATGLKGFIPNVLLNRLDPKGVSVRARLGDFTADKIHERYAGNLTGQELERAKKWSAEDKDDPPTLVEKLTQQRDVLKTILESKATSRSPDAGYAANPSVQKATNRDAENWIKRAMDANGMSRADVIAEGIRRGKLKEGYK